MARYPRAGDVKSRLAASLGAAPAAAIYRAFLADLRRLSEDPRWTFHWSFCPGDAPFASEIGGGCPAFAQTDGDLGARMAGAIGRLIGEGYRHVVLVGSDVPQLSVDRVARAFTLLADGAPVVLGPAEDGGYYLVGARDRVPAIFGDIAWGTSAVLDETLAAAERASIPVDLIEPTYDIDTVADLDRLRQEIDGGSITGLDATRAVLERVRPLGYK